MSLTLKDLWADDEDGDYTLRVGAAEFSMRPATLNDLVEVLKQEGAEPDWRCVAPGAGICADGIKMVNPLRHRRCGRYLVLPLGDTP